ncbi:hypothetical protein CKF59_03985 [Psittacicella gerlachiana]|uniref:dihydrofolate reductase n=2 Tax=Psittacicella gerlachiana TaxID=2028574 RepID=A0A3A1YDF5_9GAMM|nr:hypothetical protein CKF59_03985 [Psittacicella gerlachiana]
MQKLYFSIFENIKNVLQDLDKREKIQNLLKAYTYLHYQQDKNYKFINKAVVARDKNQVIGSNGSIYWNLPKDMENFKSDTINTIVIMGRVTFNSFPKSKSGFYLTLKDRFNIVISRQAHLYYQDQLENTKFSKNLFFVESLEQAHTLSILLNIQVNELKNTELSEIIELKNILSENFSLHDKVISTIGGESIYNESLKKDEVLLPLTDIILTEVDLEAKPDPSNKLFIFNQKDYQQNHELTEIFNGTNNEEDYIKCIKTHYKLIK